MRSSSESEWERFTQLLDLLNSPVPLNQDFALMLTDSVRKYGELKWEAGYQYGHAHADRTNSPIALAEWMLR